MKPLKGGLAALLLAPKGEGKPDEADDADTDESDGDESSEEEVEAGQMLLDAVRSKDAKGVARAMKAMCELHGYSDSDGED